MRAINQPIILTAIAFCAYSSAMAQSISPGGITLKPSQSQALSVQNAGGVTYDWSVYPLGAGQILVAGLNKATYTAPATILAVSTVTIYAENPNTPGVPALSDTITLMPNVGISVSPTWITLTNGQSAPFTATVTGATNTAVTWSVAYGSFVNGIYSVPATLNTSQNILIKATSVVDPTKSASATIALVPTISVSLNPSATSLTGGQTTSLNGAVVGTTNTAINWSMSPQVGTLANGSYTAPSPIPSAQNVTITATSAAASSRTASVVISLVPLSISLTPATASLTSGQKVTLTAAVGGSSNTGVNWSLSPAVGSVSNGVYSAPALVTTAQNVTVTATSAADASKSASAVISLTPSVSVSVTPTTASLMGGQSTTVKATVIGAGNTSVTWSMSPSVGTLSGGVYTAPATIASAQTVTVKATSAADPTKSASAKISLVPVSISVTPSTASLTGGQSATFKATLTGTSNAGVTWSMSPSVGTLSNGVYTAPATIASAQTITITGASAADSTKSDTATVSLVPVSISVTPSTASLTGGQSATFKATLTGTSNAGVNWSMSPSVGTLSNGVYTAPATIASAQTITITGASAADSTKSDTATVSLVPVSISLTPSTASLSGGQSATFKATLTGTSNTSVNWSMSPSVGTLSNGVYTAPATIASAQTITITATSAADATKGATATVSLSASPTISVALTPSTASLSAGQSVTLQATVTGSSNTAVNWSLSPQTGTVTNGVYTAPSTISIQQTVTVAAASAADATKIATAVITLLPTVSVAITPTTATLAASQSVQLSASLSGTTNPNVNWSMNPSVGSLSNGLYQAPATISSQQTVTVTATSLADATKSASATITLVPAVGLVLTPSSTTLSGGQSTQFNVTISGTASTAVSWSLNPQVGTITNGVYTAPVTINALQTIILTVASLADPTQTATATISLTTSTSPSVSPAAATLNPSQTQQFSAGGLGTGPKWSISPSTGTISSGGLYTAPATITTTTTVTVTATNATDATKHASATVTLNPSGSSGGTQPTTITLPIEVLGADGTTASVSFNIPSVTNPNGLNLWMKIHGLHYQTQASLQLNGGAWQPINNSTVTLAGLATAYGGIGGGFNTLTMTMPVSSIKAGTNTLTFRFNGTDGRVSGFRVLEFNVQDASGASLIPSGTFVNDDPNQWRAPSTNPSDIAAGQSLWRTAALTVPTSSGTKAIKAHCSDCHTQDGRDLKYFNYSNNSIRARSVFHGLTAQQGDQIASYIRALNVPNPGRPWNPPYQPGPGLDSQPVADWAAGAGLDAVLSQDSDMLQYLAPGGSAASWAANANVNAREIPLTIQLPDWNSWLPGVHPLDTEWGAQFSSTNVMKYYGLLRSGLKPGDPVAYNNNLVNFRFFFSSLFYFVSPKFLSQTDPAWTSTYVNELYSTWLWGLVKDWELNQEFQLEGMSQAIKGPGTEPRAWYAGFAFIASPNMLHIPIGTPGIHNGTVPTWHYYAHAWYQTQLILNDTDRPNGARTLDWQYVYGMLLGLAYNDNTSSASMFMEWLIKGLQTSQLDGPPSGGTAGWHPGINNLSLLVYPDFGVIWTGYSPSQRTFMMENYVKQWFAKVQQFTPQQWYDGKWASPTQVPVAQLNSGFGNWLYYSLPRLKYFGVDSTLVSQIANWAQKVWPLGTWNKTVTATCVSLGTSVGCTY